MRDNNIPWKAEAESFEKLTKGLSEKYESQEQVVSKEPLSAASEISASEIKGDKALCIIKVKLMFQELKNREVRRKGKNLKMGEWTQDIWNRDSRESHGTCSPGGAQDPMCLSVNKCFRTQRWDRLAGV